MTCFCYLSAATRSRNGVLNGINHVSCKHWPSYIVYQILAPTNWLDSSLSFFLFVFFILFFSSYSITKAKYDLYIHLYSALYSGCKKPVNKENALREEKITKKSPMIHNEVSGEEVFRDCTQFRFSWPAGCL